MAFCMDVRYVTIPHSHAQYVHIYTATCICIDNVSLIKDAAENLKLPINRIIIYMHKYTTNIAIIVI